MAQDIPKGEGYQMVFVHVAEDGDQWEFAMRMGDGSLAACNVAKRSQVVPRAVPKGNIIGAGGTSKAWTIVAVECRSEAGVING